VVFIAVFFLFNGRGDFVLVLLIAVHDLFFDDGAFVVLWGEHVVQQGLIFFVLVEIEEFGPGGHGVAGRVAVLGVEGGLLDLF
jgi:hypothetical protein